MFTKYLSHREINIRKLVVVVSVMSGQPKITFYVDIISPFAYIAFYILKVCLSVCEALNRWQGDRGESGYGFMMISRLTEV